MVEIVIARESERAALARASRAGSLERLRPGAYRVPEVHDGEPPAAAARRRAADTARALDRQLRAQHWFSHETAALLWGCALWRPPARTHVIQGYRASARAAPDVARHTSELPAAHRDTVDGLPVTSLVRTVVDCALTMHPLEALVIADSALRRGLDLDEARLVLDGLARRNGTRRAGWILDHADDGAHTAWETWLRYIALRAGLPRPRTQAPVATPRGLFRCDLGWAEWGVYAEFDGRMKYRRDGVRPGHDGERELLEEKTRFDAIRSTGIVPVRVMATDAGRPDDVVRRLAAGFPAELRRTFRVNPLLPPP